MRIPMKMVTALVLFLAAPLLGAALDQEPVEEAAAPPLHVLFIGNSLTYTNDLPAIFAALALAAGKARPFVRAVTAPGFSLEDHWKEGEAQKTIRAGGWDFVVLQQGPSASPEGVSVLRAYTRSFAKEIRAARGRPALYMVWPSKSRPGDFDGVVRSYADAAREVDGVLCPAGEAWRIASRMDLEPALYSSDGLHPTVAGSYLAALAILGRLYGLSPLGLPAKLTLASGAAIELPAAQARWLQEAAAKADAISPKPIR